MKVLSHDTLFALSLGATVRYTNANYWCRNPNSIMPKKKLRNDGWITGAREPYFLWGLLQYYMKSRKRRELFY